MAAFVVGGGTLGCKMGEREEERACCPRSPCSWEAVALGHVKRSTDGLSLPPAKVERFDKTGIFQDFRSKHELHSHVRRPWSPSLSLSGWWVGALRARSRPPWGLDRCVLSLGVPLRDDLSLCLFSNATASLYLGASR